MTAPSAEPQRGMWMLGPPPVCTPRLWNWGSRRSGIAGCQRTEPAPAGSSGRGAHVAVESPLLSPGERGLWEGQLPPAQPPRPPAPRGHVCALLPQTGEIQQLPWRFCLWYLCSPVRVTRAHARSPVVGGRRGRSRFCAGRCEGRERAGRGPVRGHRRARRGRQLAPGPTRPSNEMK